MQRFEINDLVTVVNYGKIKHIPKNQTKERPECVVCEGSVFYCVDVMPELVGKSGIVRDCHTDTNTNLTTYVVDVDECLITLEEEQLEKTKLSYDPISVDKLLDPEVKFIVVCFVRNMLLDISIQQTEDLYNVFTERLTKKS